MAVSKYALRWWESAEEDLQLAYPKGRASSEDMEQFTEPRGIRKAPN